ncbi:ABC transporter permease [Streptosporangium sp. KLBMP 9127]|nr:ABC transporter permease [Streptosporangium sp. KLBMP 9127]
MRTDVMHAVRLARVDLKLLGRNQTAMINVVLLPLIMGWLFTVTLGGEQLAGVSMTLFVLTGLPGVMLGFAVFVHLVITFTARREELVLKRLRGGQASPVGILGGSALGALAIWVFQVVLVVFWTNRMEDDGLPGNVPLLLLGGLLGVAVFALLAAAVSGITRSAELAQVAVLPVVLLIMVASPVLMPLSAMPAAIRVVAEVVPVTPVIEIMRTAYVGRDFFDYGGQVMGMGEQWVAALPSIGILLVWIAVGTLLARWLFRWDPRHG